MSIGVGLVGQSNCLEFGDLDVWLALSKSLASISFYQDDITDGVATAGAITLADWSASRYDGIPTSAYDYPVNMGQPSWGPYRRGFGCELEAAIKVRDHHSADVTIVKLAVTATFLGSIGVVGAGSIPVGWFNSSSHVSWGNSPKSNTPYNTTVKDSGTATATAASTMTDSGASWTVDEHQGRYVTIGSSVAYVLSNTDKVLTFALWLRTTPAPGGYSIDQRDFFEASLGKTYAEDVLPAAKAADPVIDFRVFALVIGEGNATNIVTANAAYDQALDLIWRLRNGAVAASATTLAAHEIRIILCEIQEANIPGTEIPIWPFAPIVNRAYREIARRDPWVTTVDGDGIQTGGVGSGDILHYDTTGVIDLGQRIGDSYIALDSGSAPARRSLYYPDQHRLVQPVWEGNYAGVKRMIGSWSGLTALPAAAQGYPGLYVPKDVVDEPLLVYLDAAGRNLVNEGAGASLLGRASANPMLGSIPIDTGVPATALDQPSRATRRRSLAQGFVWPSGAGDFETFDEIEVVEAGANITNTVQVARGCGGMISRWRTATGAIDREWMCRGHSGTRSLSMQLQIDEKVATTAEFWMRHQIGYGDHRQAQTDGVGATFLAPTAQSEVAGSKITSRALGVELNSDENSDVPTGRIIEELDHGATDADRTTVLWPNLMLGQDIELGWNSREAVTRCVASLLPSFALDRAGDVRDLLYGCWGLDVFDKQLAYDPATTTETDYGWTPGNNYYVEITATGRVTYNPAGGVVSSGASPFSTGAGFFGWQATGVHQGPADNLTWGFYVKLLAGVPNQHPTKARIGNLASAAPYGSFSAYDQLDHVDAKVLFEGVSLAAGTEQRVALFLLVGTIVQVKAAADQLYALDVDATWIN